MSHDGPSWRGKPTSEENRALRDFIHEQMRLRGWNYAEFAKAVGTDGSVVSRWIRDRKPEPPMVWQMAESLGVDLVDLMRIVGHLPPKSREESLEQSTLIAKIRQTSLTKDRYLILHALLKDLRKREP